MDIFELAHKQLMSEIDNGTRPLKAIEIKGQLYPYSYDTLLKYAMKIRKWQDKHCKNGNIQHAVDRVLTGSKEYRKQRYIEKGV